jgi:hypothetical protein
MGEEGGGSTLTIFLVNVTFTKRLPVFLPPPFRMCRLKGYGKRKEKL